jgi:hypothetical protein
VGAGAALALLLMAILDGSWPRPPGAARACFYAGLLFSSRRRCYYAGILARVSPAASPCCYLFVGGLG